ncbi:MAG: HAMP domain-containing histidine kinase [Arcobacteraceae bacterium]|nr:HAMP domain-containing histidine kinase [Arcobacteraceae bacterium]
MTNAEVIKNIFKQKSLKFTLLMTLFFTIILSLISTKYIIPSFEEQIMLNIIDESKRVSNHLISVYNEDKDFSHMKRMKEDLNIEKIKFFDKKGLILYSTSKKDIGKINTNDYYHNIVAQGKVFYKIVKKGKKTLEGRQIDVDVAEVYIPIVKNGKFIYAFEVYYDINSKVKSFDKLILKIEIIHYFIVFLILIIVFIILFSASKLNIQEKATQKQLFKSEKMASMGEMLGNIAHQWRQPLSVISTGATGMQLQKEHGVLDDETFNKTCEGINRNAQYLSKTIDDFKNYIKGDRIQVSFDLKKKIGSFINLVESSIKKNSINVILNLQDDIKIKGYPSELIQCFINIFNNAEDVLAELNKEDRYLFISTFDKKDKVIIKIKDSGGGIPNEVMQRIFEPYFTTKHQSQGTGLGLHMTYTLIVKGMGGNIGVKNVSYKYNGKKYTGAEFIISIPVQV